MRYLTEEIGSCQAHANAVVNGMLLWKQCEVAARGAIRRRVEVFPAPAYAQSISSAKRIPLEFPVMRIPRSLTLSQATVVPGTLRNTL